ncbi:MAG: PAS domain S-box protein, partial [Actinobacteria bacterium]
MTKPSTFKTKNIKEIDYKSLIDNASDAIFVADKDYNYIDVNIQACKLLSYTKKELLKLNIRDTLCGENLLGQPLWFDELLAGKMVKSERCLCSKDGTPIEVEITSKMLSDKTLVAIVRDITERKAAEKLLRRSEEKYRMLAEAANDMIFIINQEFEVDYVNQYAARALGLMPEEIVGKNISEVFPEEEGYKRIQKLKIVFDTDSPMYTESKSLFFDKWTWIDTSLTPIKNEQGETTAILGISRDITEKKEVEKFSDSLNIINTTLNSITTDFESTLNKALKEAVKVMSCDSVALLFKENDSWRLGYLQGLITQLGKNLIGMRFSKKEFPIANIAEQTREVIVVNDALKDSRTNKSLMKKFKVRSSLNAPLYVGDNNIGTLNFVYHTSPVKFNVAHIDFSYKVATSFSLAINNSELYTAKQELIEEMDKSKKLSDSLNDIYGSICSKPCMRNALQILLEKAAKSFGCESSAFLLKMNDYWSVKDAYGKLKPGKCLSDEEIKLFRFSAQQKTKQILNDALGNNKINLDPNRDDIRSLLIARIIVKSETIGFLVFCFHSKPAIFNKPQVDFANK